MSIKPPRPKNVTTPRPPSLPIRTNDVGQVVGKFIGVMVAYAIVAALLWVIIVFAIGLKLTYLQVWGGLVLVAMLKGWLRRG